MAKADQPRRLRRSESFLGIHFDFHAGDDCTQIGRTVTARMLERMLDLVRPDYVQCDCKGHRGLSSYPTEVGHQAPGFVRDPLRIWRRVTAQRGVALYMHYSGVWDSEAVRQHRSWARVDENGRPDKNQTSVFGPYVEKLLIPQLIELRDEYDVDGVWVDGDCWATVPDYSPRAINLFRRQTGLHRVPRKPGDPGWFEFLQFCREGFRRYLRYYVDKLHEHDPGLQIASNWAFSSHMPEPVSADVDFLSGDFTPQNSFHSARLEARCIANQGKPWDLMSWSFSGKHDEKAWTTKPPAQLKQEAAAVLSVGGGFQAYYQQNRDGSIQSWQMPIMAQVARFCRARQRFCHRAQAVPQVALLYSTAAYYRNNPRLFAPWGGERDAMDGALRALLDSQYSVQILSEHHLAERMHEYPLIVVPECEYLEPRFRRQLLAYVRAGGDLLLIGPRPAAMFRGPLGARLKGKPLERIQALEHEGFLARLKTTWQDVELNRRARPFGRYLERNDLASDSRPAASIARFGKGRIAATYFNFGRRYVEAATAVARDFLGALARELFPDPIVEVTGSHNVDVSATRIDGQLAINLVNSGGPHGNSRVYTFDEIPPVGPLRVSIRLPGRPRRILRQPAGRAVRFEFRHGRAHLVLPRLEMHDILVVE